MLRALLLGANNGRIDSDILRFLRPPLSLLFILVFFVVPSPAFDLVFVVIVATIDKFKLRVFFGLILV